MKKILVPTDFSCNANNAIRYAMEMARALDARIVLFHAYIGVNEKENLLPVPEPLKMVAQRANRKIKQKAAEIEKQLPRRVDTFLSATPNAPEQEITDSIASQKADMVIMGSRGTSSFMERVLGSITTYLLRKSKVPVIVVPQNYRYKHLEKIAVACERDEAFTKPVTDGIN